MDYEFAIGGTTHRISLERKDDAFIAAREGRTVRVDVHRLSPQALSLLVNGTSYLVHAVRQGETIFVAVGADHFCLAVPGQERTLAGLRGGRPDKAEGTVKAPMPGMVIKVNVAEGSSVMPGDGLVVVEAMKMEHEMRAAFQAIVDKVYVKEGQQVDAFQPLLELKPVEE